MVSFVFTCNCLRFSLFLLCAFNTIDLVICLFALLVAVIDVIAVFGAFRF